MSDTLQQILDDIPPFAYHKVERRMKKFLKNAPPPAPWTEHGEHVERLVRFWADTGTVFTIADDPSESKDEPRQG